MSSYIDGHIMFAYNQFNKVFKISKCKINIISHHTAMSKRLSATICATVTISHRISITTGTYNFASI